MFGSPESDAKILDGAGSPRWKQRALYDAMRDIAALCRIVKLVRLSIFEVVNDVHLGEALDGKAALNPGALQELIAQREAPSPGLTDD